MQREHKEQNMHILGGDSMFDIQFTQAYVNANPLVRTTSLVSTQRFEVGKT